MPTVTVKGFVSPHDAAEALRGQLGSQYEIATHGNGDQEMLTVRQSATATATVRLGQDGSATTFHIHGGGLIVSRLVNELGIAKKVATAIKEAFETVPPAEGKPSLWFGHLRAGFDLAAEDWLPPSSWPHCRVNTAWMVRALSIETVPSRFQVRPKSARSI